MKKYKILKILTNNSILKKKTIKKKAYSERNKTEYFCLNTSKPYKINKEINNIKLLKMKKEIDNLNKSLSFNIKQMKNLNHSNNLIKFKKNNKSINSLFYDKYKFKKNWNFKESYINFKKAKKFGKFNKKVKNTFIINSRYRNLDINYNISNVYCNDNSIEFKLLNKIKNLDQKINKIKKKNKIIKPKKIDIWFDENWINTNTNLYHSVIK